MYGFAPANKLPIIGTPIIIRPTWPTDLSMYEQSVYDSFAFVTLAERMRRRVVEEGLNPLPLQ